MWIPKSVKHGGGLYNMNDDDPFEDFLFMCHKLRENDEFLSFVEIDGAKAKHYNIRTLVDSLLHNTRVKDLVISNIDIDSRTFQDLSRLLNHNTTLQHLCIDNSSLEIPITGGSCSGSAEDGMDRFAKALSSCQLHSFGFSKIRYFSANKHFASALANGLAQNQTIETVYLSRNRIGHQGAKAIAKMLRVNTRIQTLHLDDNEINNVGVTQICSALHPETINSNHNTTLEVLNLERNKISSKGIIAISAMLKNNDTLKTLRIGDIQEELVLNNQSKAALVEAASQNFSIHTVHLGHYPSTLHSQVKYYTDLNCFGHRHILQQYDNDLPVGVWPQIFSKFGPGDLSDDNNKDEQKPTDDRKTGILYYYIRSKPELFQIQQC